MHVQPLEMRLARHAGEIGREPVAQRGEQGVIGKVGPALFRQQAAQELPRARKALAASLHGSAARPMSRIALRHGLGDQRPDRRGARLFLQHQGAEAPRLRGRHSLGAAVPRDTFAGFDEIAEIAFDFGKAQGRGQKNFLVARCAIGGGDGQQVVNRQAIMFRQHGTAAARKAIAPPPPRRWAMRSGNASATSTPALKSDGPSLMPAIWRICLRRLADAVAGGAAHLFKPRRDIGPGTAAKAIALRQQGREIGGKRTCAAHHHVGKARMQRQLDHGAAQRRDLARGIDGFQALQQVLRLRESGGGRRIEPRQCCGIGDTPGGEFEHQRRQIGDKDFRLIVGARARVSASGHSR